MKQVFVDTSAWIALLNTDDVWHKKARQVRLDLLKQNYSFVTSQFFLLLDEFRKQARQQVA